MMNEHGKSDKPILPEKSQLRLDIATAKASRSAAMS
jgi:hypothetical protein